MSFEHWRRWAGETVFCIASGPSLTAEDCEAIHQRGGARVMVVNTSFRLAPWADVVFAADLRWWEVYGREAKAACSGEFWTNGEHAWKPHALRYIKNARAPGLSMTPGVINGGGNSGQAIVQLAYQFGAARVVLLGYDMQRTGNRSHWHGDHRGLSNAGAWPEWIRNIERTARDLEAAGVTIVNASRATAITGIRRADLGDELARIPGPSA